MYAEEEEGSKYKGNGDGNGDERFGERLPFERPMGIKNATARLLFLFFLAVIASSNSVWQEGVASSGN